MKMAKLFKLEGYNPNALFDDLIERFKLRNDSALAKYLGIGAPVICKARNKTSSITGELLLRIWDVTGIPVDVLRVTAGIPVYGKEKGLPVVETEPVDEVAHV
jgi:hypothetical protein